MPIYTAKKAGWDNDLDFASCDFAIAVDIARMKNESSYRKVMWLKDRMKSKYQEEFELTQDEVDKMTYYDAYMYSDAVYSMRFEGIPTKATYSDYEIGLVNTTQIYGLMNPMTTKARKLFNSKILERPLYDLKDLHLAMKDVPGEFKEPPRVQYMLYSMHDF